MSSQECISEKKEIYEKIKYTHFKSSVMKNISELTRITDIFLEFLDDVKNFDTLKKKLENFNIREKKHDFRMLLHSISSISDNHYSSPTFFSKIEQTLQFLKDDIKKCYSNSEIFNIFKENKRILLFLINEKFIIVDKYIAKEITTSSELSQKYYPQYFAPEIKPFKNEKWFLENKKNENEKEGENECIEELPDDFYELRKIGENDEFICKLIREDLVEDFSAHVNRKNISFNAIINQSIYETNSFLLEKQIQSEKGITLIEYAAFFGSIQIFYYLKNNKAEITPSLLIYAIHSKNAELINLLEELFIKKTNKNLYLECFNESIRCHHNEIANYFIDNYLESNVENSDCTLVQSLKYYNFSFLRIERHMNESSFCHLCFFDYYLLVKAFLMVKDVLINSKIIQNINFQ